MWIRPNACIADSLPNRTPQPAPLEVWETSFGTTSTEEPWSKPENALTVTVPGTTTQVEVLYFFNVSRCQAIAHKWNVSTVDFNHLNVPGLAQCNPRMCWSCGELHFKNTKTIFQTILSTFEWKRQFFKKSKNNITRDASDPVHFAWSSLYLQSAFLTVLADFQYQNEKQVEINKSYLFKKFSM